MPALLAPGLSASDDPLSPPGPPFAAAPPTHAAPLSLACGCTGATPPSQAPRGSRRRRIWELSRHAHCPVVGVCLPLAVVRKLVDKVLGGRAQASDYELHCGVNAECRERGPVAEAVQRELDRRYANALRLTQRLKTTVALGAWWDTQRAGQDVPGALWATLTHPRCDAILEEQVLADIHMLQHQNGAADRADLARLETLLKENEVLARELGAAQQRCGQQAAEHGRRLEAAQAELVRARADLIGRDTVIASQQEELRALEAAVPQLRARDELARQVARQIERIQDLERALLRSRHELEHERHRADEALALLHAAQACPASTASRDGPTTPPGAAEPGGGDDGPRPLADRAVLCVGGRAASLAAYRRVVEGVGGRFLHHDGGDEDKVARLDDTLSAADLVICQTGCISHNAYWRVKDHCKRTGKRCLFVDNPSQASLKRALATLVPIARHHDAPSD